MTLGIRRTFEFTDYESGEGPAETDSHFGCITKLLLIHFWIYYHLLILLIDFIINHY